MLYAIPFVCLLQLGLLSGCLGRNRHFNKPECLDVAIVGGGIGGTYTAWKLRNQGLNVGVFEYTDRIGGRTFSVFLPSIPNVPLDLGAMRYLPGIHTTLETIVGQLGMKTKVFEPDQHEKLHYFRGKRLRKEDLTTDKLPYNLEPGESTDVKTLKWTFSQKALNMSRPDQIPDIEEFSTQDGVPVYKQGYLSMLENVWSPEAKAYAQAMDAFRFKYEPNNNAANSVVHSNPSSPSVELWTVVGGMDGISKKLREGFLAASNRHFVKMNRRVHGITKISGYGQPVYELTMYETITVDGYTRDIQAQPKTLCAEKVILAVPNRALQNIAWYPLQHNPKIQQAFKSLVELTALKIYLAYPEAWWDKLGKNSAKAFVTDNPLRQGAEFGRFRNASGKEVAAIMAAYVDGNVDVEYFDGLRKYPTAFPFSNVPSAFNISTRVLQHVHHHLAAIYGINSLDIPQPLDGVMHIWSDDKDGAAWQQYYPGFQPKTVAKFMRRPVDSENVFIVTNSYSKDLSTWTEGSLRAADDVLSSFFNIS